jgi:hypothetical protein
MKIAFDQYLTCIENLSMKVERIINNIREGKTFSEDICGDRNGLDLVS